VKKLLLSILLLAATFFYAFPQKITPAKKDTTVARKRNAKSPKLSLGIEVGPPIGQAQVIYSIVYGGSLKLEIPVDTSKFNFIVTAGYSTFSVKGLYSSYLNNVSYVPLEVGGRYYASSFIYLEGDLGASICVTSDYTGPKTAFIYAPGIGVVSRRNKQGGRMDMGLRYEGRVEPGGTVSQLALRVAYRF
jgi:hypothetical protein